MEKRESAHEKNAYKKQETPSIQLSSVLAVFHNFFYKLCAVFIHGERMHKKCEII